MKCDVNTHKALAKNVLFFPKRDCCRTMLADDAKTSIEKHEKHWPTSAKGKRLRNVENVREQRASVREIQSAKINQIFISALGRRSHEGR